MTTAQVILVLLVLFLGGVLATVGDRLGSKVGKARLSLFKLRPRQTATLITIFTGTLISASTFAILFGLSEELRRGVFEFEQNERRLRRTRANLAQVQGKLNQIQTTLNQAQADQVVAQQQLAASRQQLLQTNRSLKTAIAERTRARQAAQQILTQLETTQRQLTRVSQQSTQLQREIGDLQTERDRILAQRDRAVEERAAITQELQTREARLNELQTQLNNLIARQRFLTEEVRRLEEEALVLRSGRVAIQRGQVLASALIQLEDPEQARLVVDQLLREANRQAIERTRPGSNGEDAAQVIRITRPIVEQLIEQLQDGQPYFVRIISAANYLVGEESPIQVFPNVIPNQQVFQPGDVLSTITLDPQKGQAETQRRIELLLAAAQFRARSLGVVNDNVDLGRLQDLARFVERLSALDKEVYVKAVAADRLFTVGPLKLELVAEQNGAVVLRSRTP